MIGFIKKYHVYFWAFLIAALLFYDHHERKMYSKLYKTEGIYTVGKIKEIKPYGRVAGYNFVYIFKINNKEYESKTGVGHLSFREAEAFKNKTFLVVYLKSNVHINRIYVSVPVSDNLSEMQLKDIINNHIDLKNKIDQIPSSGWFWENYF